MGKKIQCIGRYVMDGQTLGKGTFSRIELATHGVTGCKVAIKIIDTRKIKEEYTRNNLHREARILAQIRHPHIVRLYETLKATTLHCLVLEYISGGDLLRFIKCQAEARLQESKARQFFRQLVSAIHFLHERGVAHRDLKMENILLDGKHKNIKVTDFGLSNTFLRTELMKTHCGSLEYAAPELISSSDKYGPEVDIWGIGIILYGMVMGKLPFTTHYTDQYRRQKLLVQIEKGLTEIHVKEMSLHGLSQDLSELLKKLIEPSVKLRLPLSNCEMHPWVTCNGQLHFASFQSLPQDKLAISQVKEELASMLKTTKEQIGVTVHESKCDDLSAMYNMMLDSKRFDKVFEMDFTLRQEVKKEKHKRKQHHKPIKQEQQAIQSPPTILCPDVEVASGHEAEHKVPPSHNSTNFDLMALCSAPTWLGGDRRKSRRQKTLSLSQSPNPDAAKAETEEGAAAGSCEPEHLLSPTLASTQVSQLLRRNSSRRRSRKGSSAADIPSRSSSLRRSYRKRSGTTGSGTHNPHSPAILNTPEIKIITPKQSPVLTVRRPANLQGHDGCNDNDDLNSFTQTATVGRHSLYSSRRERQRRRIGSDNSDSGMTVQSDNSNLCSTINLSGSSTDGFQTVISHQDPDCDFRTSLLANSQNEHTVESRIAATDIRSIVRPKQISFENKVNIKNACKNVSSLQVPTVNDAANKCMPSSHEVAIESLRCNSLENLSDDEKLKGRLSGELQKTDSEKRVEIEKSGKSLTVSSQQPPAAFDSATEVLEATSIESMDNFQSEFDKVVLCNSGNVEVFANNSTKNDKMTDKETQFRMIRETDHFIADLYSDRERIFLENKALNEDDICYADTCNHTSSQEKLFSRKKHNEEKLFQPKWSNKNSSTYETESVSAPILLLPQELGLTPLPGKTVCDDSRGTITNSILSSRYGSTPSVHFVMPSTPIRQMFHTPIARIDSFHSDDFDMYTSDFDVLVSSPNPSPSTNSSIQTSTVPCFQCKLHSKRKKHIGRKRSQELKNMEADGNQHDSIGLNNIPPEKNMRDDLCVHDLLTSSGSECWDDRKVHGGEDTSNAKETRIFPMENSEDHHERKSTKVLVQINDKVKLNSKQPANQNSSKKNQNDMCKTFDWKPAAQNETKRSGWRQAFVQLVKKKKLPTNCSTSGNTGISMWQHWHLHLATLASPSGNTGNNNNKDSPSQNNLEITRLPPNTHNGHARGPQARAVPPNTLDIPATSLAMQWTMLKPETNLYASKPMRNLDVT